MTKKESLIMNLAREGKWDEIDEILKVVQQEINRAKEEGKTEFQIFEEIKEEEEKE